MDRHYALDHDWRHEVTAVGEHRVGPRHLQRRRAAGAQRQRQVVGLLRGVGAEARRQIEARLARLGDEKAEAETAQSGTGAQAADFADLGRRLAHIAAETQAHEERWLELQTSLEALRDG